MEATSEEPGQYGSNHATDSRTNFSSSLLSEHGNLNNHSYGGGLHFWLLQNNSVGTTQLPAMGSVRNMALAQVEIGVLGLILALTTLGNSFVLWVLLRRRKYNAPMHPFMINLCLADLVVAFFQVLPQMIWDITERFQGPDALCRSVKYLQIVGMFASSYMIVAMTVDRHYAICCPLQAYRGGTVSQWNTSILVAWGLALLLSVPQVFIFSRSEVTPGVFECWGNFAESWGLKAYVTWMTLAVFVLPTLIITVCQVRIFREIHNNIYQKSVRVVSADMKKPLVLFHFPSLRKQDDRRDSGRQGQAQQGTRGESHQRNNNSHFHSHHKACNSQHALHPDSCDCSPQENCNTRETTSDAHSFPTPSPDVLHHTPPHTSTHTRTSQNKSAPPHDCCPSQRPLAENKSSSYQISDYSDLHTNSLDPPKEGTGPGFYSSSSRHLQPPMPGVSRAMSKTVKMTLVIVLVYTICWCPFFIAQLWTAWDPNPPDQSVAFTILMLLASLNSCTNPWIYTAFSNSVSHELLALLRCRQQGSRRESFHEDSSAIHTSTTTKDNLY